jgi:Putative adipose-regulatory protein (Seipin)
MFPPLASQGTYIYSSGITFSSSPCPRSRNFNLFSSQDAAPWGVVDLSGANLVNDQPYATFVEIELPRTQHNLGLGLHSADLANINRELHGFIVAY